MAAKKRRKKHKKHVGIRTMKELDAKLKMRKHRKGKK
jgi:hypothetical protein